MGLTVQSPPLKRNKNDFYQTPYHCTRLLLDHEDFDGDVLEPAAGMGAIVKVLEDYGYTTTHFDLSTGQDFMRYEERHDNIITNPPFNRSTEFLLHAKDLARDKIAFLLPINYLQSKERYDKVWQDTQFPLQTIYTFTRYLLMDSKIRPDGKCRSGMTLFSWFIFCRHYHDAPTIQWLDNGDWVCSK